MMLVVVRSRVVRIMVGIRMMAMVGIGTMLAMTGIRVA